MHSYLILFLVSVNTTMSCNNLIIHSLLTSAQHLHTYVVDKLAHIYRTQCSGVGGASFVRNRDVIKATLTRAPRHSSKLPEMALRCFPRSWSCSSALSTVRALHVSPQRNVDRSYQFVVCGAGAGGLAVGSTLGRKFGPGKLAVIEPREVRFPRSQALPRAWERG